MGPQQKTKFQQKIIIEKKKNEKRGVSGGEEIKKGVWGGGGGCVCVLYWSNVARKIIQQWTLTNPTMVFNKRPEFPCTAGYQ